MLKMEYFIALLIPVKSDTQKPNIFRYLREKYFQKMSIDFIQISCNRMMYRLKLIESQPSSGVDRNETFRIIVLWVTFPILMYSNRP